MSRTKPKVMKVPTSVVVGGQRVKIRVVKGMEDWGEYCHDDNVIRISAKCVDIPGALRSTLRHELTHAALNIGGVGFSERYEEESIVRCLEQVFFPTWDKLCEKYEL
jgi:hypothetical protein